MTAGFARDRCDFIVVVTVAVDNAVVLDRIRRGEKARDRNEGSRGPLFNKDRLSLSLFLANNQNNLGGSRKGDRLMSN